MKVGIIGCESSVSEAMFAQCKADDVVIVNCDKGKDVFNSNPTMIIKNYTIAHKCILIKSGKQLRRERRKNNRKR